MMLWMPLCASCRNQTVICIARVLANSILSYRAARSCDHVNEVSNCMNSYIYLLSSTRAVCKILVLGFLLLCLVQ